MQTVFFIFILITSFELETGLLKILWDDTSRLQCEISCIKFMCHIIFAHAPFLTYQYYVQWLARQRNSRVIGCAQVVDRLVMGFSNVKNAIYCTLKIEMKTVMVNIFTAANLIKLHNQTNIIPEENNAQWICLKWLPYKCD